MAVEIRQLALLFLLLGTLAGGAGAQLPRVELPPLQTPALPPTGQVLPEARRAIGGALNTVAVARGVRIEALAREHRAELDRDSRGELVVRAEVVAVDLTEAALKRAQAEDFVLKRTRELAELGLRVSVLQTPPGWSAARGLKRLRKLDPGGVYDFNHVYLGSGGVPRPNARVATLEAPGAGAAPASGTSRRAGLIDGGVDGGHRYFAHTRFQRFGCDGKAVPTEHGTAVAAILVSRQSVDEIFAADVYCNQPAGGAIDAVAAALGWMARERVAVINVSLVGLRNALLGRAVKTLVERGFLIVAAVGNDGPAAAPLYPASYEGVIGVTAVDRNHRVLVEACRGKQVDFAAEGADVEAATLAPDTYAAVRGTSFAAPVVAALFALDFQQPDAARRELEVAKWAGIARDLGKQGRDDTYGAGELGSGQKAVPRPVKATPGANK
jgi:subtilisin family serine protease